MTSQHSYITSFIGTILFLSHGGLPAPPIVFSLESSQPNLYSALQPVLHSTPRPDIFSTSPRQVTIADVLGNSQGYHQRLVSIQGLVTQPELHLNETELYLNFVFRLTQGTQSIIVYGRHDRTLGPPAIIVNQKVEVLGTFFREQDRNGSVLFNVLEAISVTPFPSSIPEST